MDSKASLLVEPEFRAFLVASRFQTKNLYYEPFINKDYFIFVDDNHNIVVLDRK